MSFLVIAYPQLDQNNFDQIQDVRKAYDRHYSIVHPHFTLVFPVEGMPDEEFCAEISRQAGDFTTFSFVMRCATIHKDELSDDFHVFLVPDEGYSQLVKMHDRLYSDRLSPYHRLDIDYIPHMGIANTKDSLICKGLVETWNQKDFEIRGIIDSIDIIQYDGHQIERIETIPFT